MPKTYDIPLTEKEIEFLFFRVIEWEVKYQKNPFDAKKLEDKLREAKFRIGGES